MGVPPSISGFFTLASPCDQVPALQPQRQEEGLRFGPSVWILPKEPFPPAPLTRSGLLSVSHSQKTPEQREREEIYLEGDPGHRPVSVGSPPAPL